MTDPEPALVEALRRGDLAELSALVEAGADIRYTREGGYDALIDSVHGELTREPRLLDLLRSLISLGVELDGVTDYQESALRVLSRIGRFDAVRLLLDAGANRALLAWTPLMEAVAIGSLGEVQALIRDGAALEDTDWWSRTAWLVALLVGDLEKAQLLRACGANLHARGRCGRPALFYAIEGEHPDVLRWLLELGQDVEGSDEFEVTALMTAVELDADECVQVLLAAGADPDRMSESGSVLSRAGSQGIAKRLLDAGADPAELSSQGRRALVGLAPEPDAARLDVAAADFRRAATRRFGTANPERMREPFWEAMVRSGVSAYAARQAFEADATVSASAIWCAQRFGQSLTLLPDGRIVQIGGEHEDSYDPDFCIYNDVFVHAPDGSITIFSYPESVFPPTDFHTATLIGDSIYVIGSLGYAGRRDYGHTPVHRLDTRSFRIEAVHAAGATPGWLYRHRAVQIGPREIRVWGGKLVTLDGTREHHEDNTASFVLDIAALHWRSLHQARTHTAE
jgi:ankyrin repeat protein